VARRSVIKKKNNEYIISQYTVEGGVPLKEATLKATDCLAAVIDASTVRTLR